MASLPGVGAALPKSAIERTSFRSSWMQPEGMVSSFVMEGRIVDVNLVNWTVDFLSQFDQKYFLNVQVSSPYMNPATGEGVYMAPEVGSKCLLCIPSDGAPPFVLCFIMPMETIADTEAEGAPSPTKAGETQTSSGASFAGGRTRAKPGDIYIKGRDGNFCILHRGGVLQIGSTELAQRIFIPLGNIISDISENYHHYNTAGAINWGVSIGPSDTNSPTFWKQTLRLFSNEDKATVRVAMGTFKDIVGEHPQALDNRAELDVLGIGHDGPIVCEVVVAPELFNNDDGTITSETAKGTKLRFMFDKVGGAYLGCAGNVLLATKKKIHIRADDEIDIETNTNFRLKAGTIARIEAGDLLELQGGVVKIGPGTDAVAHVGSIVSIAIPPGTPLGIAPSGGGPVPAAPLTITGIVTSGKPTVRV